jgi:hypothetical protein
MMIFVYVCSKCSVVELKTQFETLKARNDVNGVYWFQLFLIIVLAQAISFNVLTMSTKFRNQVLFVWLVDLQTICTKYVLETRLPPNDDIRIFFRRAA